MNEEAETQDTEDTPELIAEAKKLGWKSPDDWKGDPPKNGLMSARIYVERSNTVLPIVNARVRTLEADKEKLAKDFADFKKVTEQTIEGLSRMHGSSFKALRKKITEEFEERKLAAVETGDTGKYQQLKKDEKEALKDFDETAEEVKEKKDERKKDGAGDLPPEVKAWVKENEWFGDDEDMRLVATNYHGKLLREQPDLTIDENLAKTRKYVEKRFPGAFEKPKDGDDDGAEDDQPKRRGSPVEGGSRLSGGGGNRSVWSRIPVDAQKQADKFIDEGLFLEKGESAAKDRQKARERYAQDYLAMESK